MKNENSYSITLKCQFVIFTLIYGLVKYFPGKIPGDFLRSIVLKMFAKKNHSYHISDNVVFWYPWDISIGKHVQIGENCFLDGFGGIEIGDWTLIAHNSSLISENHSYERLDIPIYYQKKTMKKIVVGENVWIGCGVRVLLGVTIGDGAVIGAGSVVTDDIPPYAVAAGVPARIIKYRYKPDK